MKKRNAKNFMQKKMHRRYLKTPKIKGKLKP